MQLYNKYDRHLLEQQLLNEGIDRITISFYKYTRFEDPNAFRDELYLNLDKLKVFGRIYVAQEGINAQVSVPKHAFYDLKDYLYSIPGLDGIRLNIAADDDGKSFIKLKILVRHKIVADGLDDSTFNPSDVGHYLKARDFNRLIESPDTLVIDMRNHYESEVGRFKNAITPDVDTFRDSLPIIRDMLKGNEHKNVVMYCTGGIRCEKASAYFKHVGFDNVYHLEGGIINYFHQVKEENLDNKFIGKNFVFDRRLGERITDDVIAVCHQCGKPCDNHTNCANEGCHILFIQCDECKSKFNNCCSDECKDIIALPLEKQKELRKGKPARNVFKKGRSPKLIFKK